MPKILSSSCFDNRKIIGCSNLHGPHHEAQTLIIEYFLLLISIFDNLFDELLSVVAEKFTNV